MFYFLYFFHIPTLALMEADWRDSSYSIYDFSDPTGVNYWPKAKVKKI